MVLCTNWTTHHVIIVYMHVRLSHDYVGWNFTDTKIDNLIYKTHTPSFVLENLVLIKIYMRKRDKEENQIQVLTRKLLYKLMLLFNQIISKIINPKTATMKKIRLNIEYTRIRIKQINEIHEKKCIYYCSIKQKLSSDKKKKTNCQNL